ncbi:MAG: DM13 domain-containing protein [Chloroflexota bacterium]
MTLNRQSIITIGIIVLLVAVAVTFPLWRPFFINTTIDDAFPTLSETEREAVAGMPEDQQTVLIEMSADNTEMAEDTARAMLEDDTTMEEAMPADEPTVLFSGSFNTFDPVHTGTGTATIYELADGSRVLRLEDFSVTNGPQLHVLLVSNVPDGIQVDLNDDYVDLGQLRGNRGNQNYDIPADVVLDDYVAVVIYCMPFSVNFTVAEFDA